MLRPENGVPEAFFRTVLEAGNIEGVLAAPLAFWGAAPLARVQGAP